MRYLCFHSVDDLALDLLVELNTINRLVLAEVEVLGVLLQLPFVHVEDGLLQGLRPLRTGHRVQTLNVIHLVHMVELLSLLGSRLTPLSGDEEVGGSLLIHVTCQIQWDCRELLSRTALAEKKMEIVRHFHNLAEILLQLVCNCLELTGTMRHLDDANAEAVMIEEIVTRLFHDRARQRTGTRVEVVLDLDSLARGHGALRDLTEGCKGTFRLNCS